MARPSAQSLVSRVGGVDAVRRILQRFYEKLAADPMVGFHFAGRDLASIVEGQLGFLLKAFGESVERAGQHPSVAHRDLAPILRGQFDRRLVLLRETLIEEGVSDEDRKAWVDIERSMRGVIQRK